MSVYFSTAQTTQVCDITHHSLCDALIPIIEHHMWTDIKYKIYDVKDSHCYKNMIKMQAFEEIIYEYLI
jgi:hypothetical protein